MGSRNQLDGRSSKGVKRKGLRNDNQGRSPKSMARRTTQSKTHCGIQVMICGTLFLHPKEGWFITIGSRLQEVEPSHHKGQNTTTINRRSHRQTQRGQILQQAGFDLGIQQRTNQRRRQMEGSFPYEQRTIRTPSDVLWIMQFTGNIPKNDE